MRRRLSLACRLATLATATLAGPAIAEPPSQAAMTYLHTTLNTGGNRPEACLSFAEALDPKALPSYVDHVQLTPRQNPDVRVVDHNLCIGGLPWGTTVTIDVSPGLRDAENQILQTPVHFRQPIGDRAPALALSGAGYILPRHSESGVDVATVNMPSVRVAVWRLSQRDSLAMTGQNGRSIDLQTTQLTQWEFSDLRRNALVRIWSGTLDTPGPRNGSTTTAFPIASVIGGQPPGLFLITAEPTLQSGKGSMLADPGSTEDPVRYAETIAAHWVSVSDLGLSLARGTDGLHVFARAFSTATPLSGVALTLTARSGDHLGAATTDARGMAVFAPALIHGPHAERPELLTARHNEDLTFLHLDRAWFDLSNRDTGGRPQPGTFQAVIVSDRGIYRPGETVHLTTLLRDQHGRAASATPITLVLTRPDGVEAERLTLNENAQGGFVSAFNLPHSAHLGRWTIATFVDPTADPLARIGVTVENFIPQTLAVTLTTEHPRLTLGQPLQATLEGRYLYGAPGAALSTEGEIVLLPDPAPIKGFADYQFGLETDSFAPDRQPLKIGTTDAKGQVAFALMPTLASPPSLPLRATLTAGVIDPAGRPVDQTLTLPITRTQPLIGLRAHTVSGDAESQAAPIDLAASTPDDHPAPKLHLNWSILRENTIYDWIHTDEGWSFSEHTFEEPVQHGDVTTNPQGRAGLAPNLHAGRYRIVASDPASGAASSTSFGVGWWAPATGQNEAPDRLSVTARQTHLMPGATTAVHIEGPFAGHAQILIATDRILQTREIDIPKGGIDVPVTVQSSWGSGAYVLATLFRPLDAPNRAHMPVRAIGMAYIGLDQSAHHLAIHLDPPAIARPQTTLAIPVTVSGHGPVHLTLAAVDQGILGLTDWRQTDVFDAIYGRRRLDLDLLDSYAHLLLPNGRAGRIRQGGDSGAENGTLPATILRTVALYSGLVTPDAAGHATIHLNVPDFEGQLHLMATAWSDDGTGSAAADTTLRDPAFVDLTLPRFLATGDEATSLISLVSTDAPAGHYMADLSVSGPLAIIGSHDASADLKPGMRIMTPIHLRATGQGIAHLTARLHDPAGHVILTRSWDLPIRSPHLPLTRIRTHEQAPGATETIDAPTLLAGFDPADVHVTFSYSAIGGFDAIGTAQALTDRDWPNSTELAGHLRALVTLHGLNFPPGILRPAQPGAPTPDETIRKTIATLSDRQDESGRFGDFAYNDGGLLPWEQIYIADALLRAQQAGYAVPKPVLDRALDWIANDDIASTPNPHAEQFKRDAAFAARTYALYVRARSGMLDTPALRATYDGLGRDQHTAGKQILWAGNGTETTLATSSALGHLAGGLALGGEEKASDAVFAMAVDALGPARSGKPDLFDPEYFAYARDVATLTALAAETRRPRFTHDLVTRFKALDVSPTRLDTPTLTGMLEAAQALNAPQPGQSARAGGHDLGSPLRLPNAIEVTPSHLAGYTLANTGKTSLWLSSIVTGIPSAVPSPVAEGLEVATTTTTLEGAPFDATHARQNDRFLVIVSGHIEHDTPRHLMLVDLLPAGWQFEAVADTSHNATIASMGDLTTPDTITGGDDRVMAAFSLDPNDVRDTSKSDDQQTDENKPAVQPRPIHWPPLGSHDFRIAYIVRATTPGHFTRPETAVTDRYQPSITGRTASSLVDVLPR